jgi:hypothetical protein
MMSLEGVIFGASAADDEVVTARANREQPKRASRRCAKENIFMTAGW